MNITTQFPDLFGKTALPAMGKGGKHPVVREAEKGHAPIPGLGQASHQTVPRGARMPPVNTGRCPKK